MSKCFNCGNAITAYEYKGFKFKLCKKCQTLIVNEQDFLNLSKMIDSNINELDLFTLPSVSTKEDTRICINCNEPMEKIYTDGILLDRCNKCRLLLFDNGELSKFFNKYSRKPIEIMNNALFIKTYWNDAILGDNEIDKTTTDGYSAAENNIKYQPEQKKTYNASINIQVKETEKSMPSSDGWAMLAIIVLLILFALVMFCINLIISEPIPIFVIISLVLFLLSLWLFTGFKILDPQEALVFTLFGKYCGTLRTPGFYWVNPFASATYRRVSLKTRTLDNGKQKINDAIGNPIEVGIMVTWDVRDTAKALFNVNDYETFLSAQCDSALRNIVRLYPYDAPDDSDAQTLKGDSAEISESLKEEIQNRVYAAGLNILDARITHLAYSSEIAMAMLQRQQANAVLDAKRTIVEGAVGMVEMAIDRLSKNANIVLDEKTKANMVNNLLVVLCSNKDSQPVIRNDIL